jgi:hydroxymethylpyrimidine/phosphomethylpyrimidine kinase
VTSVSGDRPVPIALTIAGSDPGGGAGIQADLKTFSALRVYGMAVVAAMTAQNTVGIRAVAEVAPDFVAVQLDAVLADIPPDATKTGMLMTAEVIKTVAQKAKQYPIKNLVVDPVMVSTSGTRLMDQDALAAFRRSLLPVALLVTPNLDEAGALTGRSAQSLEQMEMAAREIHGMGVRNVLIKGGHLKSDEAIDVLFNGAEFLYFRSPRLATADTHGTGCVLSAAIAAYLARGESLLKAVELGKDFVTTAIKKALRIGSGTGPCDPLSLEG